MQKRIAILYDFDYTLSDGYMQQFGLMQEMGFSDVYEFFSACEKVFGDKNMDLCLSMMAGILFSAKEKGKEVTKEYLQSLGKNIVYFLYLLTKKEALWKRKKRTQKKRKITKK